MSGIYEDIYKTISDHQKVNGELLRLMKLSEEVGEVTQACIGYLGANRRKGVTHDGRDVAKELCDVIITAMVALHDWVDSPEMFLKEQVARVAERCRTDGS